MWHVHADRNGVSGGLPLSPGVLEIADEFLLFRVDRDHRRAARVVVLDALIDELELRVAIRMRSAFGGLVGGLEAVARARKRLCIRDRRQSLAIVSRTSSWAKTSSADLSI
jgi:hypothetical protein